MPEFVILRHEMPHCSERETHWDFMMQVGETLRTWALDDKPEPGTSISARRLPDHDLKYLDYEGTIQHGRGNVERFAHGTFEWIDRSPAAGDRIRLSFRNDVRQIEWQILIEHREGDSCLFHVD